MEEEASDEARARPKRKKRSEMTAEEKKVSPENSELSNIHSSINY